MFDSHELLDAFAYNYPIDSNRKLYKSYKGKTLLWLFFQNPGYFYQITKELESSNEFGVLRDKMKMILDYLNSLEVKRTCINCDKQASHVTIIEQQVYGLNIISCDDDDCEKFIQKFIKGASFEKVKLDLYSLILISDSLQYQKILVRILKIGWKLPSRFNYMSYRDILLT
ncbi:MAG: hypothetical protein V3575_00935 [Candidatus Absconditabacteria bacterium]